MSDAPAIIESKPEAAPEARSDFDVRADKASAEFLRLIPRDFAREHLILSQSFEDGQEILAVAPDRRAVPAVIHNVGVRLRRTVRTVEVQGEIIARAIDEAYERVHSNQDPSGSHNGALVDIASDESLTAGIDDLIAQADRDLLSTQGKGPVIKLVDAIFFEALSRGATDVHVQPVSDRTLVRYRLDGVLHTVREIATHKAGGLAAAIISRIKVMGRMDIAEQRVPQDGRATVTIGRRLIDLRISTLPTSYGERAVIRLLDTSQHLDEFSALGMAPGMATAFLKCAQLPNGIVLVTGPTGSGKTTTLYATLKAVGHPGVNILTIEDPIEYDLSLPGVGISQSQVNPRKGVTFATGLRHILRQDPDIIMVGEIRDAETARIAIQSSLTGHLVFSTLHTNDAPSAVTRLIDLGVEPYLVAASLSTILAQRLVRVVHAECSGGGCEECLNTGYRGRTGVFELLVIGENIRQLIAAPGGAPLSSIRAAAKAEGLRTLAEEGRRLVSEGRTTELEVQRVIAGVEL